MILLVEDDAASRYAFARLLRGEGYEVIEAHIHHYPRKLKTEPLGEFFHAYGKLLELKARDFHHRSRRVPTP
jgi:response regulator RpfG family c-di-GMP phosphodiesterase